MNYYLVVNCKVVTFTMQLKQNNMATKQVTSVRVNLGNGDFMTCKGCLSKDGKTLKMAKGLTCTIKDGDEVTTVSTEVKKKEAFTQDPCPFDMVNWFAKTKQI